MALQPHDLQIFIQQVTAKMASEYARIYSHAAEDPGTAGDQGEKNWAALLSDWLPPHYQVRTKGQLISSGGRRSHQVDVVVLKPSYPRGLLETPTWLADGVVAVFECKNTLKADHVAQTVQRCAAFKEMFRGWGGTPRRELRAQPFYGLLAHSHSWKAPNSEPTENIEKALRTAQRQLTHPRQELDVICVADLTSWTAACDVGKFKLDAQQKTLRIVGGPSTMHWRHRQSLKRPEIKYSPIGALIRHLTNSIAWQDPSVRDIAQYFSSAGIAGPANASPRDWPMNVYSDEVASRLTETVWPNGGGYWNEWSCRD